MPPAKTVYRVLIEGEYYAMVGGQKAVKPYSVYLDMEDNARKAGFLSAAVSKLGAADPFLVRALKAKYPDYKRYRTHHQMEVQNLTTGEAPNDLSLMNRAQITAYLDSHPEVDVDRNLYPLIEDLRQALRDYKANQAAFLKFQDKRRASRGEELHLNRCLEDLNPDIDTPKFTESERAAIIGQPLRSEPAPPPKQTPSPIHKGPPSIAHSQTKPKSTISHTSSEYRGIREFDVQDSLKDLGV